MSDDLAKRLRDSTAWYHVDCELKMKCADRIEELEELLAATKKDAEEAEQYALEVAEKSVRIVGDNAYLRGKAEGNLDTSMLALGGVRKWALSLEPFAQDGETMVPELKFACEVYERLRELTDEPQKDEEV